MKIISAKQIKKLDRKTIQEQDIVSIELMERAAITFVDWFIQKYSDKSRNIEIICGTGDNGGDGLATARLLTYLDYKVKVYIVPLSANSSDDFQINFAQIESLNIPVIDIDEAEGIPEFQFDAIAIDAIIGAGLNRPVEGFLGELIDHINNECETIVSIDIASGLFADRATDTFSILPTDTFSFELPKLAFFFPENQDRVGQWHYETIHSSEEGLEKLETNHFYIQSKEIRHILKKRKKFSHKGTYGHSLLIAGSYGMIGAAILSAKACLRTGSGLTTVHIPECGYEIMQTAVPEAIVSIDRDRYVFSSKELKKDDNYTAIGLGSGLGKNQLSANGLRTFLTQNEEPLVLDADALNIIAENEWLELIPKRSILTPHVKEFERLFGKSKNGFDRNQLQLKISKELDVIIILKGAHSAVTIPAGYCFFNSSGNPGMATAGSGDVLTGIVVALVAQGYDAIDAATAGTFIHGLAGDFAAQEVGEFALMASDIVDNIGKAILEIMA